MPADATLDGGDVLRMDRTVFVGLTARTNEAGLEFMKATLEPLGYSVRGVPLKDALHLKTGVTAIDPETVILNPGWIDAEYFSDYRIVHAHEDEPFGANVLLAGRSLFVAQHHPRTADRCASFTSDLRLVVADELAKAEGGLTCCSILLPAVEAS